MRVSYQVILLKLLLTVLSIPVSNAFTSISVVEYSVGSLKALAISSFLSLTSSSVNGDNSEDSCSSENPTRPDLVEEKVYISAIETIRKEQAKANNIEYKPEDSSNIGYAIGRLVVSLPIPPGIDLIETPDLLLINGIDQIAHERGVRTLDTIVGVAALDGEKRMQKKTLGLGMDDTYTIVKSVMEYARENGSDEMEFEFNRLIKGYYGEESSEADTQ